MKTKVYVAIALVIFAIVIIDILVIGLLVPGNADTIAIVRKQNGNIAVDTFQQTGEQVTVTETNTTQNETVDVTVTQDTPKTVSTPYAPSQPSVPSTNTSRRVTRAS
jgi:hypothetical protein